ncbi:hypothetical protein K1Y78_44945 [Streptomyces sp. tea 10]|nr:hypothetical protein [Streptomyces sp. tea 10]
MTNVSTPPGDWQPVLPLYPCVQTVWISRTALCARVRAWGPVWARNREEAKLFDEQVPLPQVHHPLETLKEIEDNATLDQESLLRDADAPWASLLTAFVDTLNEMAMRQTGHIAGYGLDEGHAGGCG